MAKFWTTLVLLLTTLEVFHSASVENSKKHQKAPHLSEKDHFHDQVHDYDYDHDAFLGADEAREFDQLSPEESKQRLGQIVDRIDSNEDGFVSLDEMRDWIRFTQQRYAFER